MNLNVNPKLLHFLAEIAQLAGTGATVLSIPGLSTVNPWIGIAGAGLAVVSTFIKGQIIGNIPATPPTTPPVSK